LEEFESLLSSYISNPSISHLLLSKSIKELITDLEKISKKIKQETDRVDLAEFIFSLKKLNKSFDIRSSSRSAINTLFSNCRTALSFQFAEQKKINLNTLQIGFNLVRLGPSLDQTVANLGSLEIQAGDETVDNLKSSQESSYISCSDLPSLSRALEYLRNNSKNTPENLSAISLVESLILEAVNIENENNPSTSIPRNDLDTILKEGDL
jgi:hypothetical protein